MPVRSLPCSGREFRVRLGDRLEGSAGQVRLEPSGVSPHGGIQDREVDALELQVRMVLDGGAQNPYPRRWVARGASHAQRRSTTVRSHG